jgi:hypothetical protein
MRDEVAGCTACRMAPAVIVVTKKVVLCARCWLDRYQRPIDKDTAEGKGTQ